MCSERTDRDLVSVKGFLAALILKLQMSFKIQQKTEKSLAALHSSHFSLRLFRVFLEEKRGQLEPAVEQIQPHVDPFIEKVQSFFDRLKEELAKTSKK